MPRAPKRRSASPSRNKTRERETASQRGYGSKWRRYAQRFRNRNPLCVRCPSDNPSPAELVDHIKPVSGANDPLFWVPSNHQGLCWSCHSKKTTTEDKGKTRR
jgi:5-methylcytosine-specific restriction enzyme A